MKKKIVLLAGLLLSNCLIPSDQPKASEKTEKQRKQKADKRRRNKANKQRKKKEAAQNNKATQYIFRQIANHYGENAGNYLYDITNYITGMLNPKFNNHDGVIEFNTMISLLTPDLLKESALLLAGPLTIDEITDNESSSTRVINYVLYNYLLINYTFDEANNLFRSKETGSENFGYVINSEFGPDSGTLYIPCSDIDGYIVSNTTEPVENPHNETTSGGSSK